LRKHAVEPAVCFVRDALRPRQRALVDDAEIDQEVAELLELTAGAAVRIGAAEWRDPRRGGFRSGSIGQPDRLIADRR